MGVKCFKDDCLSNAHYKIEELVGTAFRYTCQYHLSPAIKNIMENTNNYKGQYLVVTI